MRDTVSPRRHLLLRAVPVPLLVVLPQSFELTRLVKVAEPHGQREREEQILKAWVRGELEELVLLVRKRRRSQG